MKIAVFLICLCLFLMGGADRVFAGQHSKGCCYARTYHHEILQEGKRSTDSATPAVSIGTEDNRLLIDCLEEADTDDTLNRRFKLSVRYHDLLSYQSILNYLHNCIEAPPSFGGLVADKYILQRVLRV